MKKPSIFGGKDKKQGDQKVSTLILRKDDEQTVPRQIKASDYEYLRLYAFRTNQKMLDATNHLYKRIKEEVEEKTPSIIKVDEVQREEQKSIRLSVDFNNYLKYLSSETRVPMIHILSFFLDYFRVEMELDMNNQ
ncbi:hypothetical protein [Bhargavaea beijingensis]|uniref:hypothetical protein n=1 Tax=Bhargavaea beijingensis TaxID=426756 RepID=UPI0022259739|nr:hypothetical protein [Bhargavaea beijingensis]MCW1929557.1 hypothetical protein [Bhargavaea beijingensis]